MRCRSAPYIVSGLVALQLVALSPALGARVRRHELGAVVGPVWLVPTGRDPISVSGLHRFFGKLRVDVFSDGLTVVNRLPLERYLLGLEEVPLTWPTEALRAQAIAARTYALWTLANGRSGTAAVYGFDICASIECQVFSGADVVSSLVGFRWADAVADTAGKAIVYRGKPILARYSSTSGGRTLDNSQAFPGEPDYPYLRSVPSRTEKAAPLYRWTVRFRLADLEKILRRAGYWARGDGALRDVRTLPSRAGLHYPDVALRGSGSRRLTAEELRDVLRYAAPQTFPGRYPSAADTASGVLPETLPSNRITIATVRNVVRIVGRGWGHGVGMSQWGAHGLAVRGATHEEILKHYYTGVELGRIPDPGPIDVGVATGRSAVTASGAFRIVDRRGRTLVANALGTWTFRSVSSDAIAIDPPEGYGLPLRLGIVDAPDEVDAGEPVAIRIALSRPAKVSARTTQSVRALAQVKDAGVSRIVVLAPSEPGKHRVEVKASIGKRQRTQAVGVTVAGPRATRATSMARRGPRPWIVVVGVVLLLAIAGGAIRLSGRIGR